MTQTANKHIAQVINEQRAAIMFALILEACYEQGRYRYTAFGPERACPGTGRQVLGLSPQAALTPQDQRQMPLQDDSIVHCLWLPHAMVGSHGAFAGSGPTGQPIET